ncbi:response regulator transcription factor [Microlunatus capsulatus]|uniref:DNA-binding response OmpR family regulator n=1 Tax=Microlunatus capsulatus TaxID=99117 RepID=A0ABS4ZEH8_9ACTN|nr:response regulator transcription factor [Microlunatus capsulatus]MBP2419142.1 DNA-binding response OmpR family regulator [Microlunatus capsulatus]
MHAARILVVEDSETVRLAVQTVLRAQGFTVESRPDGSDLEQSLVRYGPDLVVLDIMLPGRDGFALLPVLRQQSRAAVLVLTARDAVDDRVEALTGGADDYLVKPFAMTELVARVQAVLRRSRPGVVAAIGDLTLDPEGSTVQRAGRLVDLTDTERRLLSYLASHQDRVVSKLQILTAVWGYDGFDPNLVEVHISSLRRKLEAAGEPRLVHTVRNRGYQLGPAR